MSTFAESPYAQITENNLDVVHRFLDAHTSIVQAARAEHASDPANSDLVVHDGHAFISATNETHTADLVVDAKLIAGHGLWRNLKTKLGLDRRPLGLSTVISELPTISDANPTANASAPQALKLAFSCVPDGKYMYDPVIQASVSPEATIPASGQLEDVLDAYTTDIQNQFALPEYVPATPEGQAMLRNAVDAFINLAADPNTRIEFGEALGSRIEGNRALQLTNELLRLHPQLRKLSTHDILSGNVFGKRELATLPDDEGKQIILAFSRMEITVTLNLGDTTGSFPSILRLELPPAKHMDKKKPIVRIQNREGRPHNLSQTDRRMVADITLDALRTQEFIEQPTIADMLKPSESLLEACSKLTKDGLMRFKYINEAGQTLHVRLQYDPEQDVYVLGASDESSHLGGHVFNKKGLGYSDMAPELALVLYDLLEQRSKD